MIATLATPGRPGSEVAEQSPAYIDPPSGPAAVYASVLTQVDQGIRGDGSTGWSSSELIFVSEHVARRLIKAGYKVQWATEMAIQDPTKYTRGGDLTDLVREHWPRKMRDRL